MCTEHFVLSLRRGKMANSSDSDKWSAILKAKYKINPVEREIYLSTQNKANHPEIYAKYICDGLKEGDVPENLTKMYREAVYGSDAKVKARIIKRMYFIGNKSRSVTFRNKFIMFYCINSDNSILLKMVFT